MKYTINYETNNSGGDWWLTDGDWYALEENGWKVRWYEGSEGHPEGRWLGALAHGCTKEFNSISDAVNEFEQITGQTLSDEGCNCCGPPHSFKVINNGDDSSDYFSGGDFVDLIDQEDKDEIIRRLRR